MHLSFKVSKEDKTNFSLVHLNIASLSLHREEFENVFKFDIISISETKIKKGIDPDYKISIDGYQQFSTPTEADKGGVLYILYFIYF